LRRTVPGSIRPYQINSLESVLYRCVADTVVCIYNVCLVWPFAVSDWAWWGQAGLFTINLVKLSWLFGAWLFGRIFSGCRPIKSVTGKTGPFSLFEFKTIQEAISPVVFTLITIYVFRTEKLGWIT
jgi:hypothetical protein